VVSASPCFQHGGSAEDHKGHGGAHDVRNRTFGPGMPVDRLSALPPVSNIDVPIIGAIKFMIDRIRVNRD